MDREGELELDRSTWARAKATGGDCRLRRSIIGTAHGTLTRGMVFDGRNNAESSGRGVLCLGDAAGLGVGVVKDHDGDGEGLSGVEDG